MSRAYVYRNRIVEAAGLHAMDEALTLGRTRAHELGHLLLPPNSHSHWGIMQRSINFKPVDFYIFSAEQAGRIRDSLTNRMSRRERTEN